MSKSSTIILLTGANSGVGYASAEVLLKASPDYHVIMAGRNGQKVKDAAAEISATGIKGTVSTLIFDVTDEDSIQAAAKEVEQQFGRVDVLVNNAGVASQNPNLKQEYQETFLANVIGPVMITEAFKPLVLKSESGCVINVSSGMGSLHRAFVPLDAQYYPTWQSYRMSKAALNMFTVQLHKEVKDKGVRVFGLCPGLVRSNLRGTEEAQVNAEGNAGSPEESGRLMLDVIRGGRDADVGRVVQKDGIWEW